jgi:hypothetical protein
MFADQLEGNDNNAFSNDIAAGGVNEVQVGMVLLPPDLDMGPSYLALMTQSPLLKKRSAEGVRLWAKCFASIGTTPSIEVPFA